MGRQQDLLFCKIAIQTGLVSQENAQKCLVFCDRREKEGQRRPMIGAVFTKHKLLTSQDVQRINEAVSRRTGAAPGAVQPTRARGKKKKKGRGGGRSHAEAAGGRGHKAIAGAASRSRVRVDQNTLWMGIGTGVVFCAIIVAILVLYVRGSGGDVQGDDGAREAAAASEARTTAADIVRSKEKEAADEGGLDLGSSPAAQVDPQFLQEHVNVKNRANYLLKIDDKPAMAETVLRDFLEQHALDYQASPAQKAEIDELLAAIAGGGGDDGGESSDEDEGIGLPE